MPGTVEDVFKMVQELSLQHNAFEVQLEAQREEVARQAESIEGCRSAFEALRELIAALRGDRAREAEERDQQVRLAELGARTETRLSEVLARMDAVEASVQANAKRIEDDVDDRFRELSATGASEHGGALNEHAAAASVGWVRAELDAEAVNCKLRLEDALASVAEDFRSQLSSLCVRIAERDAEEAVRIEQLNSALQQALARCGEHGHPRHYPNAEPSGKSEPEASSTAEEVARLRALVRDRAIRAGALVDKGTNHEGRSQRVSVWHRDLPGAHQPCPSEGTFTFDRPGQKLQSPEFFGCEAFDAADFKPGRAETPKQMPTSPRGGSPKRRAACHRGDHQHTSWPTSQPQASRQVPSRYAWRSSAKSRASPSCATRARTST